ncbi:MAG TPA: HXXEE domain-containing protein [Bryobacteraceae bacterium]|jgi:hypothetical protein|nr:HXXEE domain-containing protein [Bryobacteraceae bacterium]
MNSWLYRHWVAAALITGIFLLVLLPALAQSWSVALLLVYLQLPIYLFHQVEEHTGDRFRVHVNLMFGGVEALTPEAVLVINIPGVWGVGMLALYAALFFGVGWGLTPIYLVLVNALIHLAAGVAKREYNPGLWTALVLFLPIGAFALWSVNSTPGVSTLQNMVGLAIAILIHVAIVVHTASRARKLAAGVR